MYSLMMSRGAFHLLVLGNPLELLIDQTDGFLVVHRNPSLPTVVEDVFRLLVLGRQDVICDMAVGAG